MIAGVGCGAFNPAFLNLVDGGTGAFATLDNAPGHVVLGFINNAEVSERLVNYLISTEGGGLQLTDAERRALRPRMRFRVVVTFANGSQLPIEFVDGSPNLIDPRFDAQAFPDLNQNDLNNVVLICDVQSVVLDANANVEVFVPVELLEFELRTVNVGTDVTTDWEEVGRIPPQFRVLQVDDIDADGNTLLRRNIGIRDVPAPVADPQCGSVISITADGVLEVPFLVGVSTNPSYDQDDAQQVAGIGGRYEFVVRVQ